MAISNIAESKQGILDTADVLVRIRKKVSIPPQIKRYANICVYTKKTGSDSELEGELFTSSTKETHISKIQDSTEINFIGSCKVWNKDTLTQADVQAMIAYGETLIVTSGKTAEILANSNSLEFQNLMIWFTESASTSTCDAVVKMPNRGAFIDIEKKGKALYTLSHLLQNPDNLQYSTQIQNSEFQGIADLEKAEILDQAGFSYFFKANDLCWARGFWMGSLQARGVYADRSVIFDVKNTVARMLQSGIEFSDANLALLEARIVQAMKINPFVLTIFSVNIPLQKPSNKVQGLVSGITVKYQTAQEIRTVFIELDNTN